MRRFNVTGLCVPGKHYMADTCEKLAKIMQFIEQGEYFAINRGRQYGKTTTLFLIEKTLQNKYEIISISFEGVSDSMFETEANFCQGLLFQCSKYFDEKNISGSEDWIDDTVISFELLDKYLNKVCKDKNIVLMIDEVDKSSNNIIFLKFLGILRDKYLKRNEGSGATFHSVILAGVYDIKNLKIKMIQAGTHQLQDGEKRLNSPWNIAIDFNIDMTLNEKEITSMLLEYENDHKTGMDIDAIAKEIRGYTNGYPYLVSRICQYIENKLEKDWTVNGVYNAVQEILFEYSTLFDDIFKNIESNPDLKELLREITVGNREYTFNIDNKAIQIAYMFGIVEKKGRDVGIHNRIFETRITNYFASEIEMKEKSFLLRTSTREATINNKLNMELIIKRFAAHYYEIYNKHDIKFLERECRLLFITYLRPFINGVGFYHLESEIRDNKRTDIIIDYNTEQFIVELKLWHGESAHENAFEQLFEYLESKNKDTGYLLTFDFRKTNNTGKPQTGWIEYKGKNIFDVLVGF